MISNNQMLLVSCLALLLATATSFTTTTNLPSSTTRSLPRLMSTAESESTNKEKAGYVPKWVKKKTLADDMGDLDFSDKGIKGTISVVFKQGDDTKTTMAMPGQPIRDVATQAGQFIKYGCGKGECGTCEALCDGKWIRPCMASVPATTDGAELVIQVKEVAKKAKSSGQFFSVKSFFMGFYNNVLGMVGFVKYRRNAKKNWEERQEYEDLIKKLTLEKRMARRQAWKQKKQQEEGGFSP